MSGGDLTVDSTHAPALAGTSPRTGRGPELDLDDPASWAERVFLWLLILVWLAVAAATLGYGLPYYRLPLALRPDSPLDELLRPSGLIGQGYGVVGTFLITVGVGMYSLRKRVPFLRRLGPLHLWLEAHIFLCTLGPFLVLLHTTFKFGGIVSIAFWAMTAVALSGLFGRYVYGHIPRAIHGQRNSLESLRTTRGELVARITESYPADSARLRPYVITPPPTQPAGLVHALFLALKYDLTRRSRLHRLRRAVQQSKLPVVLQRDLVAVVRAQSTLEQQHVLLQPFQKLFHYWHVFHLPLTVVMFLVLAVHIGVAVALGYTWIF